jgi:DnaJ-domain-containing protein 1
MSTAELLTVIVGLVVGYGIIARVMGTRTSTAPASDAAGEATPSGSRRESEPAGSPAEELNHEWIRANWHEVLGVGPKASIEVIKSAYRLRAHQYHPDKTEGLGPELKALAERKMQELNMAYAWATRSRRGR